MTNLLDQLNEKQKEAVLQTQGPVLILAGAGSGKTRALTFRVVFLIQEKKIAPRNILAVTFTNKAAGEMLDRIKKLLGLPYETPPYSQYLPHIGTFHSICVKILRKEIEKMGYKSNFIIYDDQDQLALMKKVMKRLEISTDQIKPNAILNVISANKNKLLNYQDFKNQTSSQFEDLSAKCYEFYQQELKRAEALDFDDIIMKTVELFRKYPEVLEKYQKIFQYIMVDEYQDTNHAQYILLRMLSEKHKNICVVGDDWQSIYGWRQADIKNILNFEKDYPGAKVVLLEQNYRSTQNILNAAHCVISKNVNRKEKKLWTENNRGDLISVVEIDDEMKEAMFVVGEIERIKKEKNIRFDDLAVLYRTNAQSRALEDAFMRKNISYKIIGGVKFYQRKEVKDILAYLYFINNPFDKISLERIINVPKRGVGGKTVEKILIIAEKNNLSILDAILSLENSELGGAIQAGKTRILIDFAKFIKEMKAYSKENSISKVIQRVYQKSGYEMMLSKLGEEGQVRHENIQELLSVSDKYDDEKEGMQMFLEEVALVSQVDRDLEVQDAVPLMTLHSAKGLEFDSIFIVGMEEGILPHNRAMLNEKEMEEERRLCYVGITRAQQTAFLTFTNARKIYGSTQISLKSRFLDEIDSNLIEEKNLANLYSDDFYEDETIELDDSDGENFRDGQRVKHPEFGSGIVVGQDANLVSVVFPDVGIKKFAKNMGVLEKE